MDNATKEVLLQLLNSSSDDDDLIFEEFFTNMSSDDSETDDEKYLKNYNFLDIIDKYSEADFKSNLSLNRSTVEHLITNYSQPDILPTSQHGGKQKIGARREVYLYLWYISNTITFEQMATLFGIAKSSAWIAVGRVASWLVSKGGEYIKWPQGDAVAENCRKYEAKKGLTGVIGAIGCTHITITAPKENKNCYYNRKNNCTLVLQAVFDADKKFIDICCGEPGSLPKSRVLKRSALYKSVQKHYAQLFPSNTFLLGDSAYAATKWLVPPYKDNGRLTDRQRSFNDLHSSTRTVVDKTFRLLKGRFRRLNKLTEQRDIDLVRKIVVSACILHNLCIVHNDQYTVKDESVNFGAENVFKHSKGDTPDSSSSSEFSFSDKESDSPESARILTKPTSEVAVATTTTEAVAASTSRAASSSSSSSESAAPPIKKPKIIKHTEYLQKFLDQRNREQKAIAERWKQHQDAKAEWHTKKMKIIEKILK